MSGLSDLRAKIMRKIIALGALCLSPLAHAWPTPQAAVEEFLKFEQDGGRLQAWPHANYLAVAANYEEPGWDEIHVIKSYQVGAPRCEGERCKVSVAFVYEPTAALGLQQVVARPNGGTESLDYVAVQKGGTWLLESSNGAPRVTPAAIKRMLSDGL
jgi:hypothetical protein